MPRPSAAVFLLAGLVAADAVLVTGALRSTHVDTAKLALADATNTAAPETGAPSTGSSPTGSSPATTPKATAALLPKVIVLALTNDRAWRAASSSLHCTSSSKAAQVERTDDGGRNWARIRVPLTAVNGLAFVGTQLIATGLDSSCKPATYALSATAAESSGLQPTWGTDPSDVSALLTTGKPVGKEPCSSGVVDLAVNSVSDLVALCSDGSIRHSTSTGSSWQKVDSRPGVVAIATDSGSIYTATRTACGISVGKAGGGDTKRCVSGTKKWQGATDMTIVGGTVWLVSADHAVTEPVAGIS